MSGGIIGGIVIAILLLLAVIGQFLVFLLFFVYKTKGDHVYNHYVCDIFSLYISFITYTVGKKILSIAVTLIYELCKHVISTNKQ